MRNKIIILALVGMLGVAGAALAVYKAWGNSGRNNSNNGVTVAANDQSQPVEEPVNPQTDAGLVGSPAPKQDSGGNYQPPAGEGGSVAAPSAPADTSGWQLIGSSVTAQQSLSDDSIAILFYVQGRGNFSVQEKVSDSWKTVKEGIYYGGSGGLPAGEMAPGEESKTLRLLKIENGQYTAVTKEFTILRVDVISSGGIKTYPG